MRHMTLLEEVLGILGEVLWRLAVLCITLVVWFFWAVWVLNSALS